MTGPAVESLQAEIAKLLQTLESLEVAAQQGLPVADAQASARERLAGLEAQVAGAKTTAVDQRGQQVDAQVNIAHLYHVYQAPPGRATLTEESFRKVLDDYLAWVVREYGSTRLHGLQTLQRTGALDRPLAQVYTSLIVRHRPAVRPGGDLSHTRKEAISGQDREGMAAEPKQVDMADLLTLGERVAVVGGAGSGKTTYLAFVAASLAAALRGQPLDVRLKPPLLGASLPVPLLAPLRFWQVYRDECAQVPGLRVLHGPEEGSLGAFLFWFLRARYKNFDAAGDFFDRLLRGGQGCLILLDGLDEVVSVAERRTVRDEVDRLLRSQYPGNRCIVTAREAGYRDAPFGSDFFRCDVQPMTEDQIAVLVGAWCSQIYPQPRDQQSACDDLLKAITELNTERAARGQSPLVATPLMVTMVVSVKYSRRELPRERAKLYDACVDVVLSSEYTGGEDPTGARRRVVVAGGPPDKQREWLSLLAFHMHCGGRAGASLDEAGVRAILEPAFRERGELPLLDRFLAAVRGRGGLFEERGDRFQFIHLTFQEYLAAQFLARQWPDLPADFLAETVGSEWWREAMLLTVGYLSVVQRNRRSASAVVESLLAAEREGDRRGWNVIVAGEALRDVGAVGVTDRCRVRVLDSLVGAMQDTAVRPDYRRQAGLLLGWLGWLPNDLDAWVSIPVGPFPYDDQKVKQVVRQAYRISRYPVTNAQFAHFVEAGGYEDRRHWLPKGWAWLIGGSEEQWADRWPDIAEGRTPDGRKRPWYWTDPEWANPLTPVVGVSWFEAEAYCRWLTDELRKVGIISQDEVARLPAEEEWERAARGTDGRKYPWGEDFNEAWANMDIGPHSAKGTTAVCTYPDGVSPEGVWDCSGNVWEWTASGHQTSTWYGAQQYQVLCGGSWIDFDGEYARCACRVFAHPASCNVSFGFRVVVSSPHSRS